MDSWIPLTELEINDLLLGSLSISEAEANAVKRTEWSDRYTLVSNSTGMAPAAQWYQSMEKFFDNALAIAIRKNADYATPEEPYKNFQLQEDMGITTRERSLLCRMAEKLQRVVNLISRPNRVEDETVLQTLLDLAVQTALLHQMLEDRQGDK